MKTILVTGCSHTAGVEMTDKFIFDDYKKHLKDMTIIYLNERSNC